MDYLLEGIPHVFTPLTVFSFLLLLLTQGLGWIVASTVDRAPVTFLPNECYKHWTGYHGQGLCLPSLSEWGSRSEISNQFQFPAGSLQVRWRTKLISGQKSLSEMLDTSLGLWSQVSLVLVCICRPSHCWLSSLLLCLNKQWLGLG